MNPLAYLELILLALEKGPEIVRKVRDSFANETEPSLEDIVKRLNEMAPPFEADDESDDDGLD